MQYSAIVLLFVGVAKLVIALACHAGDRGFEPRLSRNNLWFMPEIFCCFRYSFKFLTVFWLTIYLCILVYKERQLKQGGNGWADRSPPASFLSNSCQFIHRFTCGTYSSSGNDTQTVIDFARNALKDGSTDDFIHQMKIYLSNFSYELLDKGRERQYQLLFLSLCVASGLRVDGEKHTDIGRIDVRIESPHHIYIIEMEFEDSADCALSQISGRKYYYRFLNDATERKKTVSCWESASHVLKEISESGKKKS